MTTNIELARVPTQQPILYEPDQDMSQFDREKEYVDSAYIALGKIPVYGPSICVYNCSDGPSTYGLVSNIRSRLMDPTPEFIFSDASHVQAQRCVEYVLQHARGVRVTPPLITRTEDLVTALQSCDQGYQVGTFVSFEPIGDLRTGIEGMYDHLPPGGNIIIVGRNPLTFGFREMRDIGREHGREIVLRSSDIRTREGVLMSVELTK